MKASKDTVTTIKAAAVLAIGFAGIVMLAKGLGEGKDLLATASVFVLLLAFGMIRKFVQEEIDDKNGMNKAIKDELEEQRNRTR